MRLRLMAAFCLCAALLPRQALAGAYADALGQCAREATTTEDRIVLMRWSFIAAMANPRLADLASISPEARERSFRAAGQVFNRVMLAACRREAVALSGTKAPQGSRVASRPSVNWQAWK